METTVGKPGHPPDGAAGLEVRLFGPLTVNLAGQSLPLPASRKVRALLAYLALHAEGAGRSQLCDLLWDGPNDPRGELRWSLSKLRSVLDTAARCRVIAAADRIRLDLTDCRIDAAELQAVQGTDPELLPLAMLETLAAFVRGEFLEGLELNSASFSGWLLAQRHRFHAQHIAILGALVRRLPTASAAKFEHLQSWLQAAPFDRRAHELLLSALAESGRIPDAESHLSHAIRLFEAEGLQWLSLRTKWHEIRSRFAASDITVVAREDRSAAPAPVAPSRRASIAVMPFVDHTTSAGTRGGLADGLVEDIIAQLAKLRTFFVIARGSVFALDAHKISPEEAGRILNVDYVVSGSVRERKGRICVAVELTDTKSLSICWTEQFEVPLASAFEVLEDINHRIVAAVAEEIEAAERNRAILKPPASLDAWEAYHRGLWHMYRFTATDNEQAQHFFRTAAALDPTFARALAGVSFTHFQNAFLHRIGERDKQIELAYESASESLILDDRDPTAHWAMGRALWLTGQQDEALQEIQTSIDLSPNFALGHYMLAFIQSQSGDGHKSIEAADYSRRLSPFDPLQFGILASRAIAHVRLGEFDQAAQWAVRAAARPNAHIHIFGIATHCLAVANRLEQARTFAALTRKQQPHYSSRDFLAAFRFAPEAAELFRKGGERIGFA